MWEFNEEVANRFDQEAKTNIPDYERVIDLCLNIAKIKGFSFDINVVDVGSATGHTVDKFIQAGYQYTWGVESSQFMIDKSLHKQNIILSDKFPTIPCEMVMANWTLHFVKQRREYIKSIYDNMTGGVFVLTDKTTQTKEIKELYYQFKVFNGVSKEYIIKKEEQLKGYMALASVDWYLNTLKEVGFKNIQIINASLGFVTFYAEK